MDLWCILVVEFRKRAKNNIYFSVIIYLRYNIIHYCHPIYYVPRVPTATVHGTYIRFNI